MSLSTDAIVFYGYVWDEEETEGIREILNGNYAEDEPRGIGVGSHCSNEYPMLYVCVSETHRMAWRGRPVHLNGDFRRLMSFGSYKEWNTKLKAFCELHDIDLSEAKGPDWYLVSDMG